MKQHCTLAPVAYALILLFSLASCSSTPPAAPEVRAGKWVTSTIDMGGDSKAQLQFTVEAAGKSISAFIYQHTCGGYVAEMGTLNNGPWLIDEQGRFSIKGDDVAVEGKFDPGGARITGSFKVSGKCSGKWTATR